MILIYGLIIEARMAASYRDGLQVSIIVALEYENVMCL